MGQEFLSSAGYLALIIGSLSIGYWTGTRSAKQISETQVKGGDDSSTDEYKLVCIHD
jgi:hypothetical protein